MTREDIIHMTQDEIIEMAREAGIKRRTDEFYSEFCDGVYADDLEAFAKLVAQHEREVVANWIMDRGFATGHGDSIVDLLDQLEWQIAEKEREACAKVCDALAVHPEYASEVTKLAALAIRARRNKHD